jgi:general secretion pathway protein A
MYTDYFGFGISPFSLTPDPNFFYPNPVYREAYANLQYGIEAKKGFIVITGEVGTGKTTLLRKLMKHTMEGRVRTVFVFNTYLNFTELLQAILYDLGLPQHSENKAVLLQELNSYLLQELKQNNIVAVLVDEAQNLSDEALEGLRLLSNMETDREKLIQIVLMGQPELQVTLDRPALRQLKQRVALQCRLAPLKPEEMRDYIDLRLLVAGYNGKDLFQPRAIRQIAVHSNGIPRLVNIICDNALLSAYATHQKSVSPDIVDEVVRDLRLVPAVEPAQTENTPSFTFSTEPPFDPERSAAREAMNRASRHGLTRTVKIGFTLCLIAFAFVAVASLVDPSSFLTVTGRGFQTARHNLGQWVLFIMQQTADQQAGPAKANAEPKFQDKGQRVIIPRGSSIYKIASDTYGNNSSLGIDLIQESNPEIRNLNRVSAGQPIVVPSLSPETLLRRQSDGSYHLIVASFPSLSVANDYGARLTNKGYQITVTARKVSDDLVLHRVAIAGLKSPEEANERWFMGIRNEALVFADN